MSRRIVIAGAIAQKPLHGGHTWVFLQYALGFARLGWDVVIVDPLDTSACIDETGRPCAPEESRNIRYSRHVMRRFGLDDRYALIVRDGEGRRLRDVGLQREELLARVRGADLLLNVMGFLDDPEILDAARRRVFLDIDPGFGQMWEALGQAEPFAGHDDFVTVGRNVGRPACTIPDGGRRWITTLPPVVLEKWPPRPLGEGAFTSVCTWRGRYAPIEYQGERYGLRVHAFRPFAALPRRSGGRFELALDIDAAEIADLALLEKYGWELVDPRRAAGDPWTYRDYVRRSGGELMIPKEAYVRSGSGWFSDRSACYLATGRPVVARDTGFSEWLPTGEGLLAFSTLEQAAAAVEEVRADWERHCLAARRVAVECLDSDRVLGRLLGELGVGS